MISVQKENEEKGKCSRLQPPQPAALLVAAGHSLVGLVPLLLLGRAASKVVPGVGLVLVEVIDGVGDGHAVQGAARSAELVLVVAEGLATLGGFHHTLLRS